MMLRRPHHEKDHPQRHSVGLPRNCRIHILHILAHAGPGVPARAYDGAVDNGRMLQTADADRKLVSLDELALLRPRKEGTRDLIAPEPIAFDAAVKQAPQEIKTDYLKEALSVLRVSPMPTINHRMFVETAQGRVMPVYVWDNVADEFDPSEQPQRMVGYHVYTYAKGPAIVVDGVI